MSIRSILRLVQPSAFDERAQQIQLLVIRDAFVTVLLFAFLIMVGLALFRSFIVANILIICILAIVVVGIVAAISTCFRNGWDWEHQRSLAKGSILTAPLLAGITVFLSNGMQEGHLSLLDWLLWYTVTLIGYLMYPLFILWKSRKRANL